jgi:hypothetical protein
MTQSSGCLAYLSWYQGTSKGKPTKFFSGCLGRRMGENSMTFIRVRGNPGSLILNQNKDEEQETQCKNNNPHEIIDS